MQETVQWFAEVAECFGLLINQSKTVVMCSFYKTGSKAPILQQVLERMMKLSLYATSRTPLQLTNSIISQAFSIIIILYVSGF